MIERPRVLIGGVGYRWHGDASLALVAADALAARDRPPGVDVADLGYGAIYAAQDIAAARPRYERVVLLAATDRGREPGRLYRTAWIAPTTQDGDELQARMREAGAGVLDVDHLLAIGRYFDAWPDDVVLLEVEPGPSPAGDGLSPAGTRLLDVMVEAAWQEALAPLERSVAGS